MASNYRSALRAVIASESRAYGFTLIVWGTGALAIHRHGLPGSTGTVAYLGGLLGGIVLVALVAFGDPHATWRPSAESRRYAGGMIHLASVSGAVAAGWLSAALVVPTWPAFLSAGASASIVYQLVLAVEVIPSLTPTPRRRRRAPATTPDPTGSRCSSLLNASTVALTPRPGPLAAHRRSLSAHPHPRAGDPRT